MKNLTRKTALALILALALAPFSAIPSSATTPMAEATEANLGSGGGDFEIIFVHSPIPTRVTNSLDANTNTKFFVSGVTVKGSTVPRSAANSTTEAIGIGAAAWTVTNGTALAITASPTLFTAITTPYVFACVGTTWGGGVGQRWLCTNSIVNPNASQQPGSGNPGPTSEPAPAKYSGPEFSGLSAKGVMTGTSPRLEGKNLDEISSIEIGGKAATFTLDGDKALDLTLPAGLAPGLYDLVINSSAGKLTHINAIQVREPKKSFSITTRSVAKISSDQYLEHSLIASMQIPELNKARCIVNASSLSMAKMMADRLCAVVKASNPNIETTVVVPRSTVSGDTVFARVIYGWN